MESLIQNGKEKETAAVECQETIQTITEINVRHSPKQFGNGGVESYFSPSRIFYAISVRQPFQENAMVPSGASPMTSPPGTGMIFRCFGIKRMFGVNVHHRKIYKTIYKDKLL